MTEDERDVLRAATSFLMCYLGADENGLKQDGMELTVDNVRRSSEGHLKTAEKVYGKALGESYVQFHYRVEAAILRIVRAFTEEKT